MSSDFNVNQISYRFYCDKLASLDQCNNLIIESSANNIELKSNNQTIAFNNNSVFNYGLTLNDRDLSNIINITGSILNVDTIFLKDIENSQANIIDSSSINYGYIRATTIGYNPTISNDIVATSNAYFTYINVSGGDSSFNDSVYIRNILGVSGPTTISNDLIVNGTSYVTLYNSIVNYISNIREELSSNKVLTLDLSATNISISNELVVHRTSFLNDVSINGHLLDSVLKVPHDFTIDPAGHDNNSGTLIINGDLIVYGNKTTIASNIIEISDITLSVATNLKNVNDLYRNEAGLDISNVASIKYDGIAWNFIGGQLTVENKKVSLDVSLIALKTITEASLNNLNSYFDLSYGQLKTNNDNSFNATYTRTQMDNSFILYSNFEISYNSLINNVNNSYVNRPTYDASISALQTYLDASYVLKKSIVDGGTYARIGQIIQGELLNSYSAGAVSINDEGNIVAIGAIYNSNNNGTDAGSVRVYRYNDISWIQISQDIDGFASNDSAGKSISLNSAGNILAFGAPYSNNSTGYVRVYRYVNDSSWIQISQNIYGNSEGSSFGWSVSLNSNGNILAISAYTNNYSTGTAIVYRYINDSSWIQISQIIECNSDTFEPILYVSLNSSGNILAFGIHSNLPGGLVRIYRYINDTSWTQISQDINGDEYNAAGYSVSLNSSGNIVAIAYPFYSQINSNTPGLVRVFRYVNDTSWTQLGLDIVGEGGSFTPWVAGDYLGFSLSLNSSGNILAIGAPNNDINGNDAGLIRVYKYNDVSWVRLDISLNIQDMSVNGKLGTAVAINALGNRVIAGAPRINNGYSIVYDYPLTSTVDLSLINLSSKLDLSYVLKSTFEGSYNKLKEQIDISFASIRLTSLDTSSISIETINTKHYSQRFNNILWNQIGLDISNGPPLTNNNKKVAISNDGKVVALSSSSHSDILKGRIYVYELSYNQVPYSWRQLGLSSEIIVGQSNDDQFGWDLALSSNGRVVAGSSILNDASGINNGQVRVFELSNNTNRWTQKGFNINGPRLGSESGYSISLAGNGNRIAIGAWKDNSNGTNAGAVRVYDFSATINDWRQQGQTIAGSLGSFEGYSTALSLDGQTLASGSITTSITRIGGTVSIIGEYIIHSFTTVGSSAFIPDFNGSVEVLIVGGGGGGGSTGFNGSSGGGGAGGVVYIPSVSVSAGTNYPIVIGDGGASGANGLNSSAFTAIAAGGGRGGLPVPTNGDGTGNNGGSGGGAGGGNITNIGGISSGNSPGTNSNAIIHGNNGGSMTHNLTDDYRAAGGGGAGTKGFDTDTNSTADGGQFGFSSGGDGIMYNILGPSYYWGGGGGGAGRRSIGGWGGRGGGGGGGGAQGSNTGGPGGGSALTSGGAGNVAGSGNIADRGGGNGGANTGGGGGGGSYNNVGGKGGSGIVVIRYLQTDISLVKTFTISGNTWVNKGIIKGPDINFGRSMKLSANGNTIVIGAPVNTINTWWSYNAWTNDASTGLDSTSSYTVAVNLGDGKIATTVNGVLFQGHALSGTNFSIGGVVITHPTSPTQNITGAGLALAGNFIYGASSRTITLTNLTIGATYKSSFFTVGWDTAAIRNQTFIANNGSSVVINPNIYGQYMGIIINCTFVADNTGTQLFTINAVDPGVTFHMYALANRLISLPNISLPNIYNTGRTYVYGHQGGTTWTQLGQAIQGISGGDEFGSSVAMSNDGSIVSIGSDNNSSNRGHVRVFVNANNYWAQVSSSISGKSSTSRAGIHALSGDGTTLIQSNNTYNSVYGINKTLGLNAPMTTISGNLLVLGNITANSLDISTNHVYSNNGYSYKIFNSELNTAIMKEYYSDVTSTRNLKVQIRGDGYITNRNNSYRSLSDSRLKENIVTSGPKLEDLLKVRVVDYTMKGSANTKYIGVLAQELEELFPNLVTELEPSPKDIEDGITIKYKAVNYSSFDSILIKSLQEQNAILKNISRRIEALEDE
jgi:hypothetical protein